MLANVLLRLYSKQKVDMNRLSVLMLVWNCWVIGKRKMIVSKTCIQSINYEMQSSGIFTFHWTQRYEMDGNWKKESNRTSWCADPQSSLGPGGAGRKRRGRMAEKKKIFEVKWIPISLSVWTKQQLKDGKTAGRRKKRLLFEKVCVVLKCVCLKLRSVNICAFWGAFGWRSFLLHCAHSRTHGNGDVEILHWARLKLSRAFSHPSDLEMNDTANKSCSGSWLFPLRCWNCVIKQCVSLTLTGLMILKHSALL